MAAKDDEGGRLRAQEDDSDDAIPLVKRARGTVSKEASKETIGKAGASTAGEAETGAKQVKGQQIASKKPEPKKPDPKKSVSEEVVPRRSSRASKLAITEPARTESSSSPRGKNSKSIFKIYISQ